MSQSFPNVAKFNGEQDVSRMKDQNLVKEIQTLLIEGDYLNDKADGFVGPKTNRAFAEFMEDSRMGFSTVFRKDAVDELLALAENAPNTSRVDYTEKPASSEEFKGKVVKLLGYGDVGLQNSIIPGGNFTWGEALHGGTRMPQSSTHVQNIINHAKNLQKAREQIGRSFSISSWYRPEPFNARAGGAKKSQHLYGKATDILVSGYNGRTLANQLKWWPGGMGIYRNFPNLLHLDSRGTRARWGGA